MFTISVGFMQAEKGGLFVGRLVDWWGPKPQTGEAEAAGHASSDGCAGERSSAWAV
jgi:hypothetical protein